MLNGFVTLTLTAQSNGPCIETSDEVSVYFVPQATAYAGADETICAGYQYTLLNSSASNIAGITWTTSGTGSFTNTASLHPTYTPSQNDLDDGFVTLTITV